MAVVQFATNGNSVTPAAFAMRTTCAITAKITVPSTFEDIYGIGVVWHSKPLRYPDHGIRKPYFQGLHHEVDVGVATSHVADKTTDAIFPLLEMQRWFGITVGVIVRPPTPCTPMAN
jgi:hypothetical protein